MELIHRQASHIGQSKPDEETITVLLLLKASSTSWVPSADCYQLAASTRQSPKRVARSPARILPVLLSIPFPARKDILRLSFCKTTVPVWKDISFPANAMFSVGGN